MQIVIHTNKGNLYPTGNCLILYIDETGSVLMNDPNYPVFGFGACAIFVKEWNMEVSRPWIQMKQNHFGGESFSMHATDIQQNIQPEQIQQLSNFFKTKRFGRLAVVTTDRIQLQTIKKVDLLTVLLRSFILRVKDYLSKTNSSLESLVIIFEESESLLPSIIDKFNDKWFEELKRNNVNITFGYQSKNENEPGLEIADFVAHTAGSQARKYAEIGRAIGKPRQDFADIFQSNKDLSSFMLITKLEYV